MTRRALPLLLAWFAAAVLIIVVAGPLRAAVGLRATLAVAGLLLLAAPVAVAVWQMRRP